VKRLRSIRGVGEWTAQYIALRQLREPDAFPAADMGFTRYRLSGPRRPTPAELLDRAKTWRPWRAYAAQPARPPPKTEPAAFLAPARGILRGTYSTRLHFAAHLAEEMLVRFTGGSG
jgi:hypothetical protein